MSIFESFQSLSEKQILVTNPLLDEVFEDESFSFEKAAEHGFSMYRDYLVIENLDVKFEGLDDSGQIFVTINGHKYGYSNKPGGLSLTDIARKFQKMLEFSAGRALAWLKRNTVLSTGGKDQEAKDVESVEEGHQELQNYMFFQNLKSIKKSIETMLSLDPHTVDSTLSQGHDWASDHIATSKDDIEEVCNWLCNSNEALTATAAGAAKPNVPGKIDPKRAAVHNKIISSARMNRVKTSGEFHSLIKDKFPEEEISSEEYDMIVKKLNLKK